MEWTTTHAEDCPITRERVELLAEIGQETDPQQLAYLRGAQVEYDLGDQEAEGCLCGAYDAYMAEHAISVRIPFSLSKSEMVLDPAATTTDLARELRWLSTEVERAGEHEAEIGYPNQGSEVEVERILRATVCLSQSLPGISLAQCLRTAIIWERG